MAVPHLLSVGYDKSLMHSRALVLRQAGFIVDLAFNLKGALALVKADSIDLLILCHTVSKKEQRQMIAAVRAQRKLLPIVCVNALDRDVSPQGCINTRNDPVELLDAVRRAISSFRPPSHQ
jgi:DNA-binding response OmpR family regulator